MARSKNPRPKTAADERYNERRRARRAAARLEKQAQLQSGKAREETIKHMNSLKKAVRESYIDKKTKQYRQTITQLEARTRSGREYARQIASQTRDLTAKENARMNKMVRSYFEQANKTESQKVANEPRNSRQKAVLSQKNFFYGATKQLWFAGSVEMRDENILYGMRNFTLESGKRVQNMQDAMQWVKEQYTTQFPTDDNDNLFITDTFEDAIFAEEEEEESDSPPIISLQAFRAAGWRP